MDIIKDCVRKLIGMKVVWKHFLAAMKNLASHAGFILPQLLEVDAHDVYIYLFCLWNY